MSSIVRVTVDRVVLRGLAPVQRTALLDGLRTELERTLVDPAVRAFLGRGVVTPVIRMGRVPLAHGASAARMLGRQVARKIVGAPMRGAR